MLPEDVAKKIKMLEIRTRRLVNNLFAGQYHTHFKGQGMTFADFREYVPGDDIRSISWSLTAKTGKTFVKRFEEERELNVILAVDISESVQFGSHQRTKAEVIQHIAAALALAAVKNNDQVGLLLFTDQVELFIPPKKGRTHVQRLLRDLMVHKPVRKGTSVQQTATFLQGYLKKRSSIFFISDFLDDQYESNLRLLAKKHEVVACVVLDPLEKKWPELGWIHFEDAETGDIFTANTAAYLFKKEYLKNMLSIQDQQSQSFKKSQVEKIIFQTDADYIQPLIEFFKKR